MLSYSQECEVKSVMSEYRTLNELAYEHLRRMIYEGELTFNRIYSETKLARDLSVSRTPMRDALNRLAQERYIDILPNRGFTLHTPTQADVLEAYHVRLMIEGYCAQIVAQHYPDEKTLDAVGHMEAALEQQRRLLDDGAAYSLSQFWLDDLAFHKSLLEYMGISSLCTQYDRYMHIFMPHHLIEEFDIHEKQPRTLERHRSTLIEHKAIIDALRSRNTERVQAAVRGHVDSSLNALQIPVRI